MEPSSRLLRDASAINKEAEGQLDVRDSAKANTPVVDGETVRSRISTGDGPSSSRIGNDDDIIVRRTKFVADISRLLESAPAAEELASTWEHPKVSAKDEETGPSSNFAKQPRLRDVRAALDTGKPFSLSADGHRGIPMWIVVRTCKATWHRNGLWPLLGADELYPHQSIHAAQHRKAAALPSRDHTSASVVAPPRSMHPMDKLLRPPRVTQYEEPEP